MNVMQPTTHRRLWWLGGMACLLVAVLVVGLLVRVHQVRVQAGADRQAGLEAVEAGEYERGLGLLGAYLNQEPDDVEALYHFALARREVQQPRQEHLSAAATVLERVVRLDPKHLGAARELAAIYTVGGRHEQAVEAADRVLEHEPGDSAALRAKVGALRQMERHEAAIFTARDAVSAHPDELHWQLLLLELYREVNQPRAALEHAQAFHGRNEDDAQAQLLLAAAHHMAGQADEAMQWLEAAAASPAHDATFVRELVGRFDALGEHERATQLLQQVTDEGAAPAVVQLLARRLWHLDDPGGVLARLDEYGDYDVEGDPELAAIETLAALAVDEAPRAAGRIDALRRAGDPLARSWAALLEVVAQPGRRDWLGMIDQASEVLTETPTNPEALLLLGEAYAAIDEPYAAISAWSSAAEHAPVWAEPLLRASALSRAQPRAGDAMAFAREARRRAPEQVATTAAVVLALAEQTQITEHDTARLLDVVREVQTQQPFEPGTLPLYVALLWDAGEAEQAAAVVREAIAADVPLAEDVWLRLAASAKLVDGGLAVEVFEAAVSAHGPTPGIALGRALHEAEQGDPSAAAEAFDALRDAADVDEDDVQWALAWARYLEASGSPDAGAAWTRLIEGHVNDVAVQLAAGQAASVRADRGQHRGVIRRLEELTQRRGYTWRVANARWLLEHPNATAARLVEALQAANAVLDRVPHHVEARLVAAACLHRLDNDAAALEHLHTAQQLRPRDLEVNLQLASMLLERGDFPLARRPLEQYATFAALRVGQSWRVALRNEPTTSDVVVRALDVTVPLEVLQARHHWQRGELTQARALYEALVEEQVEADAEAAMSLPAWMLTADFFAGVDDWQQVEAVAARLSDDQRPAGSSALLMAELHHHHVGAERGAATYRALTESTPENAFAWRERIGLAVGEGRINDALALLEAAGEATSGGMDWSAVQDAERVLRVAEIEPNLRPLAVALVREAEHREVARHVLELIATAYAQPAQRESLVPRLRTLAEQHPRLLALQTTVIRVLSLGGEHEQAAQLARRAMRRFPDAGEPAELATQLFQASEQWETLINVAHERKRLSPRWGLDGDALLAGTYIRAGQPEAAVAQLQPHVSALQADPQQHFDVLATYLHGLVAAGESAEAAAMMRPWLSGSADWRQAWRWMAGLVVDDAATAAEWLTEVAAYTPEDAFGEQLDLIQQWNLLAGRFDQPSYEAMADERLAELARHPEAPAQVHVRHGQRAEATGDQAGAEHRYRRALEADAAHIAAGYRLARLLAQENRELDEALHLARRVAAQQPGVAEHLDLHAFVAVRAGEHEEALSAIEQLRARDGNQLLWRLTHAWVLVEAGEIEQARQVFTPVAEQLPAMQPLPENMDARLARIREALPELTDVRLDSVPAGRAQ